jgi:hypothetical protein
MAHFAKLDNNNTVIDVHVVNNEVLNNLPFPQSESLGIAFLTEWSGGYTNWKQCSYNHNFRASYAGIGYIYDATNDVFYPPQPYPSWTLDQTTWLWSAPVTYPSDGKMYFWSESDGNWLRESTMSSGTIPNTTL